MGQGDNKRTRKMRKRKQQSKKKTKQQNLIAKSTISQDT